MKITKPMFEMKWNISTARTQFTIYIPTTCYSIASATGAREFLAHVVKNLLKWFEKELARLSHKKRTT